MNNGRRACTNATAATPRSIMLPHTPAAHCALPHCRVQGLNWQPVASSDEVQALLEKGARTRATAATALNAASSRSHAVVSVKVMQRPAGGEGRPTISHLHLVDLGGKAASGEGGCLEWQCRKTR